MQRHDVPDKYRKDVLSGHDKQLLAVFPVQVVQLISQLLQVRILL